MPKFSQYLEAAATELPAIISVVKAALPALEDFYAQQKTVLAPYIATIKTDVAAVKSASEIMKVVKIAALAEDAFDVWPMAESAFGELKTLVGADYTQVKASVTTIIAGTAAVAATKPIVTAQAAL